MKNIAKINFLEQIELTPFSKSTSWEIQYDIIDEKTNATEVHKLYFVDKDEAMRVYLNLQTAMETQKPDIVKIKVDKDKPTYIYDGSDKTNDLVNRAPFFAPERII